MHNGLQFIQFPASFLLAQDKPLYLLGLRFSLQVSTGTQRGSDRNKSSAESLRPCSGLWFLTPGEMSKKNLGDYQTSIFISESRAHWLPSLPTVPQLRDENKGNFSPAQRLQPSRPLNSCLAWAVCLSGAFQAESISWLQPFPTCPLGRCVTMIWPKALEDRTPAKLSNWAAASLLIIGALVSEDLTGHRRLKKSHQPGHSVGDHIFSQNLKLSISYSLRKTS